MVVCRVVRIDIFPWQFLEGGGVSDVEYSVQLSGHVTFVPLLVAHTRQVSVFFCFFSFV